MLQLNDGVVVVAVHGRCESPIAAEISDQKRNQTKLRAECLARDNNRCMLTGAYDSKMAVKLLSDAERRNVITVPTEVAHIIPFSLAAFDEREVPFFPPINLFASTKAIAWDAMYHAFPSIRDFSTDDINNPRNVLTLWDTMHRSFGRFEFCLGPTVRFFLPFHPVAANPFSFRHC